MKCLEKDKRFRYQNAGELLQDLAAFRQSLSARYDRVSLSDFMRKHFQAGNNAPEGEVKG
jgi:hypothetical protein